MSPSANFINERKKLKYEGNDYPQKTHHSWNKSNKLKAPCFEQAKNTNRRFVRALQALCTFWEVAMEDTAYQWSQLFHKS